MTIEKDNYVFAGKRISKSGYIVGWGQGISVRDYFAAHVDISGMNILETFKIKEGRDPTVSEMCAYASEIKYIMADAMMEERNKDD